MRKILLGPFNKKLNVFTLKEVIPAGSIFRECREFWVIYRRLIPAKFLAKTNS